MTYKLSEISRLINGTLIGQDAVLNKINIAIDSRTVCPGDIFIAIKGAVVNSHSFIPEVVKKNPSLIISNESEEIDISYPHIKVQDTKAALSILAAEQYLRPADKIKIIGITGTNGKTSTVWIINEILNLLGKKSLRIGTLGISGLRENSKYSNLTTPGILELNYILSEAVKEGIEYCVMEVSSHALDQGRVQNIDFFGVGLTNITRDHLDYHKTFENYIFAKEKLFCQYTHAGVVATDHQVCRELYARNFCEKLYSVGENDSDFIFSRNEKTLFLALSLSHQGNHYSCTTNFVGAHNKENFAVAISLLYKLGIASLDEIFNVIPNVLPVPGRLEPVGTESLPVFVDYAHTPDALEKVLIALKPVTKNKLWVVFGCGGNRDAGKRPIMAEVAERFADKVVVTSDNPREEDPACIINDILSTGVKPEIIDADRKQAILKTLKSAVDGDTVLIAGKGHEDYQIIGKEKIYFSDQKIVKEYFGI